MVKLIKRRRAAAEDSTQREVFWKYEYKTTQKKDRIVNESPPGQEVPMSIKDSKTAKVIVSSKSGVLSPERFRRRKLCNQNCLDLTVAVKSQLKRRLIDWVFLFKSLIEKSEEMRYLIFDTVD